MAQAANPSTASNTTRYLDHVTPGWFVLDVMREKARGRCWVALMVDIDPDDLMSRDDCRLGFCKPDQGWFRIPGKHRSKDAAWDVLEDLMSTRH